MVGFDPEAKKKLTKGEYGTAGAVSGTVTRFLSQPLDVIKIRFQVNSEFVKNHVCSKRLGYLNTW
jgi:solute carrier family 25 thiamine pyrophosphate transporter 19